MENGLNNLWMQKKKTGEANEFKEQKTKCLQENCYYQHTFEIFCVNAIKSKQFKWK